jgi:hypothetical protein
METTARRLSVLTQGVHLNGHSVLVSLYEDVGGERVDVRTFNPASLVEYTTSVNAAAWGEAGYGGKLSELTAEERHKLHQAICRWPPSRG